MTGSVFYCRTLFFCFLKLIFFFLGLEFLYAVKCSCVFYSGTCVFCTINSKKLPSLCYLLSTKTYIREVSNCVLIGLPFQLKKVLQLDLFLLVPISQKSALGMYYKTKQRHIFVTMAACVIMPHGSRGTSVECH